MIDLQLEKSYYTIGEVAEMFKLNTSTLRYWQDEFEIISPQTNKNGERRYTPKDVKDVQLIYHLLKEKGLKLKAAKDQLKTRKNQLSDNLEFIHSLEKIKNFLSDLKKSL